MFLALAVLAQDPAATGVLCMEEPENGIHPSRVPAMISLLDSIAMDPDYPQGPDNPLRQVIVNTHSPLVVQAVKPEDLIFAYLRENVDPGGKDRFRELAFGCVDQTWRAGLGEVTVAPASILLPYMSPQRRSFPKEQDFAESGGRRVRRMSEVLEQLSLSFEGD